MTRNRCIIFGMERLPESRIEGHAQGPMLCETVIGR